MKRLSMSIVVPTYNEKRNIGILLKKIEKLFKGRDYEVLVVDDSSPDGTGDVVKRLTKKNRRFKLVTRTKKEGIGAALRHGYNLVKKDVIMSTDADLSFEPKDLLRLMKRIEEGYDLVVGNRYGNESGYEKTTAKIWLKGMISRFGNSTLTLGLPVNDLSANFRAIRRAVWRKLKTKEKGNAILGEMIINAHRSGYRVGQVDVVFKDRRYGESKLSLFKEAPKFALRVLRLRFF